MCRQVELSYRLGRQEFRFFMAPHVCHPSLAACYTSLSTALDRDSSSTWAPPQRGESRGSSGAGNSAGARFSFAFPKQRRCHPEEETHVMPGFLQLPRRQTITSMLAQGQILHRLKGLGRLNAK